jgi:hypothetical protein
MTFLKEVVLKPSHVASGGTRHIGPDGVIPQPARLRIAKYDNDGFYLLHIDAKGGELADTFHPTMEDALRQAQFELTLDRTIGERLRSKERL